MKMEFRSQLPRTFCLRGICILCQFSHGKTNQKVPREYLGKKTIRAFFFLITENYKGFSLSNNEKKSAGTKKTQKLKSYKYKSEKDA